MDHYNKGGEANPFLDGGIEPLALSEEEIDQMVAFLFTLTDDRFAEQNQRQFDRQKATGQKAASLPRRGRWRCAARLPFEQRVEGPANTAQQQGVIRDGYLQERRNQVSWKSADEFFRRPAESRPPLLPEGLGGGLGGHGRTGPAPVVHAGQRGAGRRRRPARSRTSASPTSPTPTSTRSRSTTGSCAGCSARSTT